MSTISWTSTSGVTATAYQLSDIGSQLAIGTFCHENGHMLCDYPDLYDYGDQSAGVGYYCLMCAGNHADPKNPVGICAYLKRLSGWAGTITAGGSQNVTVTFAPTAVTSYSGTVTVSSDATSGANTISASGTGTVAPTRIIGLIGSLAFGSVVTNTTAAFFIDAQGQIVVRSNSVWVTNAAVTVSNNVWRRFTMNLDYRSRTWALYTADGTTNKLVTKVADGLGFYSTNAASLKSWRVREGASSATFLAMKSMCGSCGIKGIRIKP
jgi:hypothetical protein